MPSEQGPYLKTAVLCQHVLREIDNVPSLIRIIDRITHTRTGPDAPLEMPPVSYNLTAFISLTSGEARGSHEISIELEEPSGLRKPSMTGTVLFEGEDKGVNLVLNIATTFEHQGLYWFNVYLDDKLLTKIPLRVIYSRVTHGTSKA
jgi:hypothetical protein